MHFQSASNIDVIYELCNFRIFMPSAVLLTGAPLHDLPVFWKNQSRAARMERLTVRMFTCECSSVASEEGTLQGGMNFKESTHSIPFSADSRQSRVGGKGLISLKLDLTVRSGSYIIKGVFQMSPMLETVQYTHPYTHEYGLFRKVTFSTRHTWVTEEGRRSLNRWGDP